MSELVNLSHHPDLTEPILLICLEGWIDAGAAAAGAMTSMTSDADAVTLATFDTDVLIDYRARRPSMRLVNGLVTNLDWPKIELRVGVDPAGRDVLFLTGQEPDRYWHAFTDAVVDLAMSWDVRQVIGLGSYPAPVPHTREAKLALTTCSRTISASRDSYVRGTLDVPAGMFAALEERFDEMGVPAFCLWSQVPHYASNLSYPAASLALIRGVNAEGGLSFGTEALASEAASNRIHLDDLIAANPEHGALVRQLETFQDDEAANEAQSTIADMTGFGDLPSGDQLAAELQEFLRGTDDGA